MNVRRVGSFIRDQRVGAKLSLRKTAGLAGVSIPYLSQIERGLRKPSAEILQAIAKGLRISAETLYVQAGILDERPASDVATSVMADLSITESQKRALLQIYQAFREETGRAATDEVAIDAKAAGPGKPAKPAPPRASRSARPATGKRSTSKRSTTTSRRPATGRGGGRKAGGGTGSQAGSSPHPAPTRSPATN
jgi:transcriptional regulator with XRE-family HTH domain